MGRHVARDTPVGLESVDDPAAPWGRRADGTPCAKPGRKPKSDREKLREDKLTKLGHDVSVAILDELRDDPDAIKRLKASSPSTYAALVGNVVGKILPRVLDARAADESSNITVSFENRWQANDPPDWFRAKHKKKTPASVAKLWEKKQHEDAEAAYNAANERRAAQRVEGEQDGSTTASALAKKPTVEDLLRQVRDAIEGNDDTVRTAIVKFGDTVRAEDAERAAREQAAYERRLRDERRRRAIERWDDRIEGDIIDAEWRQVN